MKSAVDLNAEKKKGTARDGNITPLETVANEREIYVRVYLKEGKGGGVPYLAERVVLIGE